MALPTLLGSQCVGEDGALVAPPALGFLAPPALGFLAPMRFGGYFGGPHAFWQLFYCRDKSIPALAYIIASCQPSTQQHPSL